MRKRVQSIQSPRRKISYTPNRLTGSRDQMILNDSYLELFIVVVVNKFPHLFSINEPRIKICVDKKLPVYVHFRDGGLFGTRE
jgi:hypothetical protein